MTGQERAAMTFSLVLCTKDRSDQLANCLAALEGLEDASELQVLLVDNGSTDGISYALLKRFAATARFACMVIQSFERGNSAGRNAALSHATGRYVLFIDDDCYVHPTYLVKWREALAEYDVGYGTGMITRFDPAASFLGCVESEARRLIDAGEFVGRGFIQGSNMMFSADCLAAVGPFDKRFGAGTPFAGEEWDVALRASYAGWRGAYFPGPKVAHDHRRFGADADERELFYDFGGGAVYAKNSFGRGGLKTMRTFLGEVRRQANSRRRAALLNGFLTFVRRNAARKT